MRGLKSFIVRFSYMQEFNPKLVGYSLGDALSTDPAAQLNVAEGGAMSRDITFMATYLVNKIKEDPRIDIKKHCKVRIFVDKVIIYNTYLLYGRWCFNMHIIIEINI